MSTQPSHDLLTWKVGKEGKKIWTKIGVMFLRDDGSFTIKLDALPFMDEIYAPINREKGKGSEPTEPDTF